MDRADIEFGIRVRKLRLSLGLSQETLADRAGLHRTYISLIERGLKTASLSTILKLSAALGAHAADLLADFERDLNDPQTPRNAETTDGS